MSARIMLEDPKTLGDKLALLSLKTPKRTTMQMCLRAIGMILNAGLLGAIMVLSLLTYAGRAPDGFDHDMMMAILLILAGVWVSVVRWQLANKKYAQTTTHWLLYYDRQRFMGNLRLDTKTAIIDGSNIYHFGHGKKVDAQPLGLLANSLRDEGYRVVCFFDANIFFTLTEHSAFAADERHSIGLLMDIFGLAAHEIYVVPSGVQADGFILESLHQLPISFAVTNDLYRDFVDKYPDVMQSKHWRKGVSLTKNEVKLQQYSFVRPLCISD
jgi:hypothetical protein